MSIVKDQELNESIEHRARDAEFELFLANRNPADADGGECERISQSSMSDLAKELGNKIDAAHKSGDPIRLETDGVFDSAGYPLPLRGEFIDNLMATLMQPLIQYFEAIKPKMPEPIKSEHKVKMYHFKCTEGDPADLVDLVEVEREIEAFLNDGYCCHIPTVVNGFLIMDFSRRKIEG